MGLYPTDIFMYQQQTLGITPEQRADIGVLLQKFQGKVTKLQWAMLNEHQKLRKILGAKDIEADPALAQAAQALKMESEFKLAHFELLIAIKNELTDERIDTLDNAIHRRLPKLEPEI